MEIRVLVSAEKNEENIGLLHSKLLGNIMHGLMF